MGTMSTRPESFNAVLVLDVQRGAVPSDRVPAINDAIATLAGDAPVIFSMFSDGTALAPQMLPPDGLLYPEDSTLEWRRTLDGSALVGADATDILLIPGPGSLRVGATVLALASDPGVTVWVPRTVWRANIGKRTRDFLRHAVTVI